MDSVYFQDLFGRGWGLAKAAAQATEPYQPAIASAMILGKLSWRLYRQKPLEREIGQLKEEIKRIDSILEKKVFRNEEPARSLRNRLQTELDEKRHQRNIAVLTFGQIPSLFFSHPGANVYQSLHQLIGRGVHIRHHTHPSSTHLSWQNQLKNGVLMGASLVSLVGTTASLGRFTGFIASDNQTSHLLSRMAMAVHTIEGAFIAYDGLKKVLAWCQQKYGSRKSLLEQIRLLEIEHPIPSAS